MSRSDAGGWRGERGTRHERGYGATWDKLRRQILDRDKWLCLPCLAKGRTKPARSVDHIIPRSRGGTDDHANLQAICPDCHHAKTTAEGHEAAGRKVRPRTRFDSAGRPIWE